MIDIIFEMFLFRTRTQLFFVVRFQCSELCGGGVQERKVVCQSFEETKELFGDEICAEPKPLTSIPCNEQSCRGQPKYVTIVWNFGEWSKVKSHSDFSHVSNRYNTYLVKRFVGITKCSTIILSSGYCS